jgi:hypothetical protein
MVSKVSSTDPMYELWDREQVVVLLSRTFQAKEMYFHGNPADTAQTLFGLLQRHSQYLSYMRSILSRIAIVPDDIANNRTQRPQVVDFSITASHPFRPCDIPIPCNNSGFVYMLVSLRHPEVFYIGKAKNLFKRLSQHNQGKGASVTAHEIWRPWGVLAYISGFEGDDGLQYRLEQKWKHRRDHLRNHSGGSPLHPTQVANIGQAIVTENPQLRLKFVVCGKVND